MEMRDRQRGAIMPVQNNLDMTAFNDDDVLSFRDGTVRVATLRHVLDVALSSKLPDALADSLTTQKALFGGDRQFRNSKAWMRQDRNWFQDGIDCEVLQLGAAGWQQGKLRLRVTVEFVPDELTAQPAYADYTETPEFIDLPLLPDDTQTSVENIYRHAHRNDYRNVRSNGNGHQNGNVYTNGA